MNFSRKIVFSFLFIVFSNAVTCQEATKKDSVKFFDYYLLANILGRTRHWDVGVEQVKKLNKSVSIAWQFSFYGGLHTSWSEPEAARNPRYISMCIQPSHLLLGRALRFETGFSANLQFYSFLGKKYPPVRSLAVYQDVMILIYSVGLRYTFSRQQLSCKLLVGPAYGINLQSWYHVWINSGAAELGLSWRLRKKVPKA